MDKQKLRNILQNLQSITFKDTFAGKSHVNKAISAIQELEGEEVAELKKDIDFLKPTNKMAREEILRLESDLSKLRGELEQVSKELASCTPNGSEFYNNSARCISYIKEQKIKNGELIIKTIKERNKLQAELEMGKKLWAVEGLAHLEDDERIKELQAELSQATSQNKIAVEALQQIYQETGRPYMHYAPNVELKELQEVRGKIIEICKQSLDRLAEEKL